jgi:hypothetical protein
VWPFGKGAKLKEWETKVLNRAADTMNDQRYHLLETAPKDPEFFKFLNTTTHDHVGFYETAFLWGFFSHWCKACPVEVDEVKETKHLIELRALARGESSPKAAELASSAVRLATSKHEVFGLVADIGVRATGSPQMFTDSMTEFLRIAARRELNEQDR